MPSHETLVQRHRVATLLSIAGNENTPESTTLHTDGMEMLGRATRLLCGAAVGALMASSAARAADFTVSSGETVTSMQWTEWRGRDRRRRKGRCDRQNARTRHGHNIDRCRDHHHQQWRDHRRKDAFSTGIYSIIGDGTRIVNSGTITAACGTTARASLPVPPDTTIVNSGTILAGGTGSRSDPHVGRFRDPYPAARYGHSGRHLRSQGPPRLRSISAPGSTRRSPLSARSHLPSTPMASPMC